MKVQPSLSATLAACVEAGAAVEAFGEGVVDGEADIGGGVGLGLLHDPESPARLKATESGPGGKISGKGDFLTDSWFPTA
jgi:hypothetical protein